MYGSTESLGSKLESSSSSPSFTHFCLNVYKLPGTLLSTLLIHWIIIASRGAQTWWSAAPAACVPYSQPLRCHEKRHFGKAREEKERFGARLLEPLDTWVPPVHGSCAHHPQGRPSRWRRSKMWRSPSSPQIHQKYIYMWNTSYRTPTECWQKTSDFPKGKKIPMYLGRAKEKRKNRDKRIGMGPAPLGGSCEGRKVSTH